MPDGRTVRLVISNVKRFEGMRTLFHQRHRQLNVLLAEPGQGEFTEVDVAQW